MKVLARKESIEKISKDLPIFFVSGADDPVGDFGKAVQKVYDKYKNAGFEGGGKQYAPFRKKVND